LAAMERAMKVQYAKLRIGVSNSVPFDSL